MNERKNSFQILGDGCNNDFLKSGLSTKYMPVTKVDLIDVLCDYIMEI
jgi:sentrin-specific protease 1